jgi:hypothetical protein
MVFEGMSSEFAVVREIRARGTSLVLFISREHPDSDARVVFGGYAVSAIPGRPTESLLAATMMFELTGSSPAFVSDSLSQKWVERVGLVRQAVEARAGTLSRLAPVAPAEVANAVRTGHPDGFHESQVRDYDPEFDGARRNPIEEMQNDLNNANRYDPRWDARPGRYVPQLTAEDDDIELIMAKYARPIRDRFTAPELRDHLEELERHADEARLDKARVHNSVKITSPAVRMPPPEHYKPNSSSSGGGGGSHPQQQQAQPRSLSRDMQSAASRPPVNAAKTIARDPVAAQSFVTSAGEFLDVVQALADERGGPGSAWEDRPADPGFALSRKVIIGVPEHCYRVVTTVRSAPEAVAKWIRAESDLDNTSRTEIQRYRDAPPVTDMCVVHAAQRQSPGFFQQKRDFVVFFARRAGPAGKHVILQRSVTHNACPEKSGYTRGDIKLSGYVIEPNVAAGTASGSKVTVLLQVDAQGWLFSSGGDTIAEEAILHTIKKIKANFQK